MPLTLAACSRPAIGFSSLHSFLAVLKWCCRRRRRKCVLSCHRQGVASPHSNSKTIHFKQGNLQHRSSDCSHTSTGLSHFFSHCLTAVKCQSRPARRSRSMWSYKVQVLARKSLLTVTTCFPPRGGALFGFCFNTLSPLGAGPWTTHTAVPKTS